MCIPATDRHSHYMGHVSFVEMVSALLSRLVMVIGQYESTQTLHTNISIQKSHTTKCTVNQINLLRAWFIIQI